MNPQNTASKSASVIANARIVSITDSGKINPQNNEKITRVKLKIEGGKYNGATFEFEENAIALPNRVQYAPGDRVIATISDNGNNSRTVYVSDYDRTPQLLVLFALFFVVIVAVARRQAIMSFIGMLISLYAIAQIILPSILAGTNAFTITMIASLIIIPATYYLSHGFNKKTTIAVISTFIVLMIVVGLSYLFTTWTHLSGFESEEASFLQLSYGGSIDILSLLLAGMLIGALAVLDDITISQSSIVASLRASNSKLSRKDLYKHAMNVGRDHVASLVNTLILVYVGVSFPLLLLFYNTQTPFLLILNQEIIATEIVRTLVASIGIVLAVPITTYFAVIWE
jgi:uncharacterized membrane protein